MRWRRSLSRVALLAALFAALPGGPAESLTTAPGCTLEKASFARPPLPESVAAVPVVIHYMIVDARRADGTDDPRLKAQRDRVLDKRVRMEALFAPATQSSDARRLNVNDLWMRADIQFYLLRTERCEFSTGDVTGIPIPEPKWNDLAMFRDLSWRFNTPGLVGMDVYLWPSIDNIGGYASPTRYSGAFPGPGAVWTHAVVLEQEKQYGDIGTLPLDSTLLVAHEIGHFFGLSHRCTTDAAAAKPPGHPELDVPGCPTPGSSGLLMSAYSDGLGLPRLDREVAKRAALKLLGIH